MGQLGQPTWFHAGDRDLATHIFRSKLLADGKTLSEATSEIAARLGIRARILPMSNSRVETRVLTPAGDLSFEEYFVQRWYQDPVESVRFAGASDAEPAPGVTEAIRSADLVLLAPSNPVTSIGPILAVPGIREALRESRARIAAVSPIVGGAAVTGPAGILMAAQGFAVSIAGVADFYHDFLDLLVVDSEDASAAEELRRTGMRVHCTPTIMRKHEDQSCVGKDRSGGGDAASVRSARHGAGMILVPIKNLADAKQRLSSILGPEERFTLAQAMCEDVLQALAHWQSRPAVAVVTSDSYARDLAARFNFEVVADNNSGETSAIEMATAVMQRARSGEHPGDSRRYSFNRQF